jgi:hypothetical protein
LWINVSTIVFDNQRTGRRLLIRLARDITQRRRTEEVFARMLDVARTVVSLDDEGPAHSPVEPLFGPRAAYPHARGRDTCAAAWFDRLRIL